MEEAPGHMTQINGGFTTFSGVLEVLDPVCQFSAILGNK